MMTIVTSPSSHLLPPHQSYVRRVICIVTLPFSSSSQINSSRWICIKSLQLRMSFVYFSLHLHETPIKVLEKRYKGCQTLIRLPYKASYSSVIATRPICTQWMDVCSLPPASLLPRLPDFMPPGRKSITAPLQHNHNSRKGRRRRVSESVVCSDRSLSASEIMERWWKAGTRSCILMIWRRQPSPPHLHFPP